MAKGGGKTCSRISLKSVKRKVTFLEDMLKIVNKDSYT
jgi:hypothetical protein